jgi:hypothetical protein
MTACGLLRPLRSSEHGPIRDRRLFGVAMTSGWGGDASRRSTGATICDLRPVPTGASLRPVGGSDQSLVTGGLVRAETATEHGRYRLLPHRECTMSTDMA